MKQFFVIIHSPGPAWKEGEGFQAQGLRDHGEWVHGLYLEGVALEGGPFLDDSGGMTIISAEDLDAAKAIAEADPAARSGIMDFEVRPWYRVDWASYGE